MKKHYAVLLFLTMAIVSSAGTIKEEIAFRLNEAESDNTTFYLNQINLCLRDIETSFPDAPFLQTSADRTLSSGTRVYTNIVPSNFSKMNSVTLPANNTKVAYVPPEQFDIIRPSATETGNPTIYTIRGSQNNSWWEFFPVPGSALTIHLDYAMQIDTVSAESATPNIPLKYYELPVLFGEMRGLRRRGRYTEAQEVAAQYEALKDKMRSELLARVSESQRIKHVREFQRIDRAYDDPIKNVYWGDRTFP